MILADFQIKKLCTGKNPMISPFQSTQQGSPSFGLSSYGYDVRLASEFVKFRLDPNTPLDPRAADNDGAIRWVERCDNLLIEPGQFILGHTHETFTMPKDVIALCVGKSSFARCGIIVNVTPLEPGWTGQVTLEISNTSNRAVRIPIGHGIAQFLFLKGDPCEITYASRRGKYQGQSGVTLAKGA